MQAAAAYNEEAGHAGLALMEAALTLARIRTHVRAREVDHVHWHAHAHAHRISRPSGAPFAQRKDAVRVGRGAGGH